MANPFVHVELNTTDPDQAKAFYRRLFDWGWLSIIIDPTGAALGLWRNGQ